MDRPDGSRFQVVGVIEACGTMDWTSRPKPRSTCRARFSLEPDARRGPLAVARSTAHPGDPPRRQQVDSTLPVYDPKPMNAIVGSLSNSGG
jgi:hypothetical protein